MNGITEQIKQAFGARSIDGIIGKPEGPFAVVYVRTATEQQDTVSLAKQLFADIEAANLQGFSVRWEDVRLEIGVSAMDMERPVMGQLLNDTRDGRVKTIFAYAPDRLFRSVDALMSFLNIMGEYGVSVRFVQEINDSIQQILKVFADAERGMFVARMKRGKEEAKKRREQVP